MHFVNLGTSLSREKAPAFPIDAPVCSAVTGCLSPTSYYCTVLCTVVMPPSPIFLFPPEHQLLSEDIHCDRRLIELNPATNDLNPFHLHLAPLFPVQISLFTEL